MSAGGDQSKLVLQGGGLCLQSLEYLETGKERLVGNQKCQAGSGQVKDLRRENEQLKQLVAELALKNKVLTELK
jgi:hypothetical protein